MLTIIFQIVLPSANEEITRLLMGMIKYCSRQLESMDLNKFTHQRLEMIRADRAWLEK